MHTVYISIHLGKLCDSAPGRARTSVVRALLKQRHRWLFIFLFAFCWCAEETQRGTQGLATYCCVHGDESSRPNLFLWPFVELRRHTEVHSNIMAALPVSACARVSLRACARKSRIWSSVCSAHTSVWVSEAEQSVSLHKYNMCPENLEALLPPHWSISITLPSLPQSGQRTDFPGAHV